MVGDQMAFDMEKLKWSGLFEKKEQKGMEEVTGDMVKEEMMKGFLPNPKYA